MRMMNTRVVPTIAIVLPLAAGIVLLTAQRRSLWAGEWPSDGGTNWSQKYSPLDQITRENFKDLRIAWTWNMVSLALRAPATAPSAR